MQALTRKWAATPRTPPACSSRPVLFSGKASRKASISASIPDTAIVETYARAEDMETIEEVIGRLHQADFRVIDEQAAFVFPAQILCAFIRQLLEERGL